MPATTQALAEIFAEELRPQLPEEWELSTGHTLQGDHINIDVPARYVGMFPIYVKILFNHLRGAVYFTVEQFGERKQNPIPLTDPNCLELIERGLQELIVEYTAGSEKTRAHQEFWAAQGLS